MSSLNQVQLIGNVGKDPETRHLQSGDAVVNLSVATSESWKDKQTGEKKEKTEWHNVVFFGKIAEIAGQYLKKGTKVFVQGSLRTRKWQDKDGNDRYTTEVVVDSYHGKLVMLGSKNGGQGGDEQRQEPARSGGTGRAQQRPDDSFEDDDIPF